MEKLSAAQVREVIAEVPGTMRKLAAERDFYRKAYLENASRQRIEKVATAMIEKGIKSGSVGDVADEIEKQAAAGDLDLTVIEQAVAMSGPDMGKRASLSDDQVAGGSSELERFILS